MMAEATRMEKEGKRKRRREEEEGNWREDKQGRRSGGVHKLCIHGRCVVCVLLCVCICGLLSFVLRLFLLL